MSLLPPPVVQPGFAQPAPRTSGLASMSLFFAGWTLLANGTVLLFCWKMPGPVIIVAGTMALATAILGTILGTCSLVSIRRGKGRTAGAPLAVTGLVGSAVFLVIDIIAVVYTVTVFVPAAREMEAMQRLRVVTGAAIMYAHDNGSQLPRAETFPIDLQRYARIPLEQALTHPNDPNGGRAYAMNRHLSGLHMASAWEPSDTVLFFECRPGTPPGGGREDLPAIPRNGRTYIIGCLDGAIHAVPPEEINMYFWAK